MLTLKNPPSIPTLALVWMVGRIRGCKVIIDWHNLGYSILALKLGKAHFFVRLAERYVIASCLLIPLDSIIVCRFERHFGRSAYAHLFVSQAMCDFLVKEWNLQYDSLVSRYFFCLNTFFFRGRKAILH